MGLPSLHTGYWDPLFAACEETGTVVCLHVGSSGTSPMTAPDAPPETVAVFVTWPGSVGVTTMVTVADAPTARLPTAHRTVAESWAQVPCVEATEENVASTDSGQQARKPDPDALKAVR